jgi:Rrf2 family protein
MFRLPRRTTFTLEAVADIAYNARPNPVQAKEITQRQGIPQRYLEQVMQHLVHAGILKGVRGPNGGYTLARERRRITLGEVVRAVAALEGDSDGKEDNPGGSALGLKVVRPLCDELAENVMRELDQVTLEDICERAKDVGIPREGRGNPDFTI